MTRSAFRSLADALKTKTNVPDVADAEPTLDRLRDGSAWDDAQPETLDALRNTLAPLTPYVPKGSPIGREVYTRFTDALRVLDAEDGPTSGGPTDDGVAPGGDGPPPPVPKTREDVAIALQNLPEDTPVGKLRRNEALTPDDDRALTALIASDSVAGSVDAFRAAIADHPPAGWAPGEPLSLTVRRLVGLTPDAARAALADIYGGPLDDRQRAALDQLAAELAANGVVSQARIMDSPYTDHHPNGLVGVFPDRYEDVTRALRDAAANATAGGRTEG